MPLRLATSFRTPEMSSTEGRFCETASVLGSVLAAIGEGKLTLMPTLLELGKGALLVVVVEVDGAFAEREDCCCRTVVSSSGAKFNVDSTLFNLLSRFLIVSCHTVS